ELAARRAAVDPQVEGGVEVALRVGLERDVRGGVQHAVDPAQRAGDHTGEVLVRPYPGHGDQIDVAGDRVHLLDPFDVHDLLGELGDAAGLDDERDDGGDHGFSFHRRPGRAGRSLRAYATAGTADRAKRTARCSSSNRARAGTRQVPSTSTVRTPSPSSHPRRISASWWYPWHSGAASSASPAPVSSRERAKGSGSLPEATRVVPEKRPWRTASSSQPRPPITGSVLGRAAISSG